MVSEKKIFWVFPIISLKEWPPGVASLDPRCLIGRIYVGDPKHHFILNLLALSLIVSEKKFFLRFFSYIVLYKHMTPLGMASLEPKGLIGRIYGGDH